MSVDECNIIVLPNVGIHSPRDTATHRRRPECSGFTALRSGTKSHSYGLSLKTLWNTVQEIAVKTSANSSEYKFRGRLNMDNALCM